MTFPNFLNSIYIIINVILKISLFVKIKRIDIKT